MPPRDPWPLLAAVRHFRIAVAGRGEAGCPATHLGSGLLQITASDHSSGGNLIWHQSGAWTSGPLAGTRFRNTTEWRRESGDSRLHLSHLRRGSHAPTFLAHLVPGPGRSWVAERPHTCGSDLYLPTLQWASGWLSLTWEVSSPTDPYTLEFEAWSRSP